MNRAENNKNQQEFNQALITVKIKHLLEIIEKVIDFFLKNLRKFSPTVDCGLPQTLQKGK